MPDAQITCVTKSAARHEAITGVGGAGWWWTVEQVIQSIDAKTNTFFTMDSAGNRADVLVVNAQPRRYIRTIKDGVWTDNLLALPPCPGH